MSFAKRTINYKQSFSANKQETINPQKTACFKFKVLSLKLSRAFTLVELLMAIMIVGILAGIITYSVIGQQRKARDAQRKNDLNQIKRALESAKNDCHANSYYPHAGGADPQQAFNNIASYLQATNLMQETPLDPRNSGENVYRMFATSTVTDVCPDQSANPNQHDGVKNYVLVTQLEVVNDPTAAKSKTSCASALTQVSLGSFDINVPGYYFVCPD